MSETKHTPGPWRYVHLRPGFDEIRGPEGEDIAFVNNSDGFDAPFFYPVEANAHMIAAAPCMAKAGWDALHLLRALGQGDTFEAMQLAAALRKTGEAAP